MFRFGCMQPKRNIRRLPPPPTAKPARLELPPDRAFVLHLDARAQPPRRAAGRVEHVTSEQLAHIMSLRELLAFLAKVLRNQVRGEPEAYATLVLDNCQSGLAASARGSLDKHAGRAAAQPILRGRKRGAGS